ncbi:hypothetical protein GTZ97_10785 [Aquabacterium fontiphilum]|uniref:hypothetical protein n=1 Tax=Aquabacterium fontiphilum TaxID=450365 RepID=UPI0013765780|nr:hypothetical protein [Aquabacterium fontiphilum]NBD21149.1 hypothetical protein [Aquabacterium fontiphilum]
MTPPPRPQGDVDPACIDVQRRRILKQMGATAWVSTPAGIALVGASAHAQTSSQPVLERLAARLNLVSRHTMAGVAAFSVPGNDLYSMAQGQWEPTPGGVSARTDAFLGYMFDNYLPLPGASQLATALAEPFYRTRMRLGDGTSTLFGSAIESVLSALDAVPLSLLLTLMLNGLAVVVRPSSALTLLGAPFCALSWQDKAKVFGLIEAPGDDGMRLISDKLMDPLSRTAVGYVQLSAAGLLTFAAAGAYGEWAAINPLTRRLNFTPVGWQQSKYEGPSIGWNEFKGYYQDRRSADHA